MILDEDKKVIQDIKGSLPLTPELAQELGWYIESEDGQKGGHDANGKPLNWSCITMQYRDEDRVGQDQICAPLRFWYEPQDKLKYIKFDFWFYGQNDIHFRISDENSRYINTVQDLVDCLEFIKLAKDCEHKLKKFVKDKLAHLKIV